MHLGYALIGFFDKGSTFISRDGTLIEGTHVTPQHWTSGSVIPAKFGDYLPTPGVDDVIILVDRRCE